MFIKELPDILSIIEMALSSSFGQLIYLLEVLGWIHSEVKEVAWGSLTMAAYLH